MDKIKLLEYKLESTEKNLLIIIKNLHERISKLEERNANIDKSEHWD